jgi:hypothetical protein
MHNMPLSSHLYMARRFDEAISAATAMQERIPEFSMHWLIARFYWEQGRFDKALQKERLELEWRGDTVLLAAHEEGLEAGGPTGAMQAIAYWPHLDVLHDDPRYLDLLERIYGRRVQDIRRPANSKPRQD